MTDDDRATLAALGLDVGDLPDLRSLSQAPTLVSSAELGRALAVVLRLWPVVAAARAVRDAPLAPGLFEDMCDALAALDGEEAQ